MRPNPIYAKKYDFVWSKGLSVPRQRRQTNISSYGTRATVEVPTPYQLQPPTFLPQYGDTYEYVPARDSWRTPKDPCPCKAKPVQHVHSHYYVRHNTARSPHSLSPPRDAKSHSLCGDAIGRDEERRETILVAVRSRRPLRCCTRA